MSAPAKLLTTAQRIEALEHGRRLDESPLDGFPPSPWASGSTVGAPITIERVKTVVAEYFDVGGGELTWPHGTRLPTRARMIAMLLARDLTGASYPEIGRAFCRDHTTVIYACRRIKAKSAVDDELHGHVATLRAKLTARRAAPCSAGD